MKATIAPPTTEVKPSDDPAYVTVWPLWSGVDRPYGTGISVQKKLASRLARAMEAGAVFLDPQIKTDINGNTYIEARCMVLGRHVNADLKKLGF